MIRQGLQDFSVSRARVKWGIPVPEEPAHVFYVWVDALSNYITALGFADDAPELPAATGTGAAERMHLIGKEIIRFHCLYWPAHAARRRRARAHARLRPRLASRKNGKKLSKTTGNIIDPEALVDAVRRRTPCATSSCARARSARTGTSRTRRS